MILQELVKCYDKLFTESALFSDISIPILITIDFNGNLIQLEDTRERVNNKLNKGREFLVPRPPRRSSGKKACLLWDNAKYVFGLGDNECGELFIKKIEEELPNNKHALALLNFLKNDPISQIQQKYQKEFEEIKLTNSNIIFKIDGSDKTICEECIDNIKRNSLNFINTRNNTDICLVSGINCAAELTHPAIKGLAGAQASGASLVSFNCSSACSFNKVQNLNAPISKDIALKYTAVLNEFLKFDSKNKKRINDITFIFWSTSSISDNLNELSVIWGADSSDNNPNKNINNINEALSSPYTGNIINESDDEFCVLGLAPNAGRISIKFWNKSKISDAFKNISKYYEDIDIISYNNSNNGKSIYHFFNDIFLKKEGKFINCPPYLIEGFVRAIFDNTKLPNSLLDKTLARIVSNKDVSTKQASLLKLIINRNFNGDIKMCLDCNNTNTCYLLGRLFAFFEKAQKSISPNLNATIKDKYFSSFMNNPRSILPVLIEKNNFHLKKNQNKPSKFYIENKISEIISLIKVVPSNILTEDRANFCLGYYHQKHDFIFKNKITNNEDNLEENFESV
jgi:CRISPR-associated protein Csd1